MINFQKYIDSIRNLIEENRKFALLICGVLLAILLLVMVLLIMNESSAKKVETEPKKLVLDQPLLVPAEPTVPNGYITSRKTKKNWNDEEIEQWFTLPDSREVEKLGEANDRIINEIIGAAP